MGRASFLCVCVGSRRNSIESPQLGSQGTKLQAKVSASPEIGRVRERNEIIGCCLVGQYGCVLSSIPETTEAEAEAEVRTFLWRLHYLRSGWVMITTPARGNMCPIIHICLYVAVISNSEIILNSGIARYGSVEQADGELYAMLTSPRGGGTEHSFASSATQQQQQQHQQQQQQHQQQLQQQLSTSQRYGSGKMSVAGYGKPGSIDMPKAKTTVNSMSRLQSPQLLVHNNSAELSDFSEEEEEDDTTDLRKKRDVESFSRLRSDASKVPEISRTSGPPPRGHLHQSQGRKDADILVDGELSINSYGTI
jgi:hypothetical protein